jgi:rod shape-determining protein MreC
MSQKSILGSAFLLLLIALIYKNQALLTQKVLHFSTEIKTTFLHQKDKVQSTIQRHFSQAQQIKILQKRVKELEPKASLSVAFASRLNHLLKESDLSIQHPQLHLVETLGYVNIADSTKLWLDFPHFNKEKNYGLIYRGFTAGIIRQQAGLPLAILQSSKESLFSVFIGEDHIQGVAFGAGKYIDVKYIPNYENPQVGDEVITSGHDEIFYEGIKVGKVIAIEKNDMYTIATLKPYADLKQAHFFYAVEVK